MLKKNILIFNQYASTPDTGIGGRHYYLGKKISKLGHSVYLFVSSSHHLLRKKHAFKGNFCMQKISKNFNIIWVKVYKYENSFSFLRIVNWFLYSFKIHKIVCDLKLSKLHTVICSTPSLIPYISVYYLSKKFKSKLIWDVRDLWPLTLIKIGGFSKYNPLIYFLHLIEKFAIKKSDLITSNLSNGSSYFFNQGVKKTKYFLINNGINLDDYPNSKLHYKYKKQIPKNKFIIGYCGTIGKANDLNTLVHTAYATREFKDIHYLIVGEGSYKETIKNLIKNLKIQNISLVASVPKSEIMKILKCCDVCYAGFKNSDLYKYGIGLNKLPEYLFSGKPVVLSVNNYKNNFFKKAHIRFVKPENIEALKKTILSLKKLSKKEKKVIEEVNLNFVKKNYDNNLIAKKLIKIISLT